MIDRDIHLATALLIESNPRQHGVAAGQLRDSGVAHVTHVSRGVQPAQPATTAIADAA